MHNFPKISRFKIFWHIHFYNSNYRNNPDIYKAFFEGIVEDGELSGSGDLSDLPANENTIKEKIVKMPQFIIIFGNDAVFRGVQTSVQRFFSNDELRIILKNRNLEIRKHSIFFKLLTDKERIQIYYFLKFIC